MCPFLVKYLLHANAFVVSLIVSTRVGMQLQTLDWPCPSFCCASVLLYLSAVSISSFCSSNCYEIIVKSLNIPIGSSAELPCHVISGSDDKSYRLCIQSTAIFLAFPGTHIACLLSGKQTLHTTNTCIMYIIYIRHLYLDEILIWRIYSTHILFYFPWTHVSRKSDFSSTNKLFQ